VHKVRERGILSNGQQKKEGVGKETKGKKEWEKVRYVRRSQRRAENLGKEKPPARKIRLHQKAREAGTDNLFG